MDNILHYMHVLHVLNTFSTESCEHILSKQQDMKVEIQNAIVTCCVTLYVVIEWLWDHYTVSSYTLHSGFI